MPHTHRQPHMHTYIHRNTTVILPCSTCVYVHAMIWMNDLEKAVKIKIAGHSALNLLQQAVEKECVQ